MSLPLEHQSRLSDTSVRVKCPPNSGDSKKLNGSPSRTRTTRPTKNAKDGTPSERRTDVGNAEVHHSVAENREQDGTQVGDDMDTVGTDDDEKETDNENNAGNGNSEWSIFSKRKPNRKVKPDQLRLERVSRPHFALSIRPLNKVHVHDIPKQAITAAIEMTTQSWELAELAIFRYDLAANSIKVTVRDDEHAERLAALTRLAEKTCGRVRSYEVSIERTPAQKAGSSRGVIKVRPGQTIEYIIDHLRCETAKIIDARLLGKTNMLLLTFDTESPPTRLVFDYEITKVHEYRPKVIACYNCHGLGHIAKYCPSEEVCKECGRKHSKDSECDDELFCVACQKEGHISLNSACPSRVPKDMKKMSQHVQGYQRTVSWSETVRESAPKQLVASSDYEQQIKDLRKENQQLRAMLQEILARLPPSQRATQPGTPVRPNEPIPSTNCAERARSRSRVGRSLSRKTTANSRKQQPAGTMQPQQSRTLSASTPLTTQDSAYAQMLNILRQERYTETQRLEKKSKGGISGRNEHDTNPNASNV
ncbi:hypothetical protein HPB50_021440 [Hyalomma asiaticum]|uniref:Uncharacterized protein n=1 Tax=Hyalomma asiaticum TaxID=266040 RepID=A0ACB7TLM2_HYAAI|nr:hypothetical protein HPB50_021440 [Hyalomma asiaticum]